MIHLNGFPVQLRSVADLIYASILVIFRYK